MAATTATQLISAIDVLITQATACSEYARTTNPSLAAYNLLFVKKDPTEVSLKAILSNTLTGATASTLQTITARQASLRALLNKDLAKLQQRTLASTAIGVINKDVTSLSANINLLSSILSWATRFKK
jgi:hypothetical protein